MPKTNKKVETSEINQTQISCEEIEELNEKEIANLKEDEVVSVIMGHVCNCDRLNVRKGPSLTSDILCVVERSTELVINEEESTDEFYKVYTEPGIEGFCMKNYVNIIQ